MSRELAEMRIKLTQEKYDLKRAKMEAERIWNALRAETKSPYLCQIEELNLDRARDIFDDLHAKWRVINALIKNIARLEAELE